MKRSARQAAKESAEAHKQYLRNKELNKQALKEKAEAAAQLAIQRDNKQSNAVGALDGLIFEHKNLLWKKGSRLFRREYVSKLNTINKLQAHWKHGITSWHPKGKAPETLYLSLCDHLFAKYHMPNFLWSGLESDRTADLVLRIAGGGSVYEEVKSGRLAVPLTRKMCHELMTRTLSDVPFIDALRQVQVRTAGGTETLFIIWRRRFNVIGTREEETFWYTVLEWFAKHPMLAHHQISPLIDYIAHRRQEPNFSLKGREPLPLIRDMQDWHGELARVEVLKLGKTTKYSRAGFNDFIWEKGNGDTWTCEEILTPIALSQEGRILHHCVFSYHSSVEKGIVSIWSLRLNDERKVTIEVRNDTRKIVQVRGLQNRKAEHEEMKVLLMWANANRISVSSWI